MNRCAVHVGRLVEIRATSGYRSRKEVDAIMENIGQEIAKIPATQRVVTVTDWRRCPILSAEASEHLLRAITSYNPRTERSAAIASRASPTSVMQFVRLVRDSKHPDRRLFFSVEKLTEWLDEILSPAESARLRAFLAERDSEPA